MPVPFVTKRRLVAIAVGLALIVGYGVYRIQNAYPDNRMLSAAGWRSAGRVLLGQDILLTDFQPRSTLVAANRPVPKAKYAAIDVHFHLNSLDSSVTPERLVAAMDSVGLESVINLDFSPTMPGRFATRFPERFISFTTLQLGKMNAPDFKESQTARLEEAVRLGARGIKVPKSLGLKYRDSTQALIPIDTPRLDTIWTLAGQLGIPVQMHNADPVAFFRPIDRFNERYVELHDHPDWGFAGPGFPPFDSLMAQRERLLRKHPQTVFIGAHVGNNASDLRYAGHLLDTYANYYVEISSRLSELGRQPRIAREFFVRHQDRILFGTDGGFALDRPNWSIEKFYQTHFKFLETDADYFDYPLAEITKQGSWMIYGLNLPDSVLAKIYAGNARRLIPTADATRARLRRLRGDRAATNVPDSGQTAPR